MKINFLKLLTLSFICVTISCNHEDFDSNELKKDPSLNDEATLAKLATGNSKSSSDCHFEYEGELGPDNWANLCGEDWKDCAGNAQSPINIAINNVVEDDDNLENIYTRYKASTVDIYNNGHTIQFNYDNGSSAFLNGIKYDLKQFHFHTGSEHTVNGYRYDMEMHLVHQDPNTGLLAVIGVFFVKGRKSHTLKRFMNNLPRYEGDNYTDTSSTFYVEDLLPYNMDYYTYNGSLTTPGCNEIVTWYVVKTPITASPRQLAKFKRIMHSNYRPVQELNGRVVLTNDD